MYECISQTKNFCDLNTSKYAVGKGSGIYTAEFASSLPTVDHPLLVSSPQLALAISITYTETLIKEKIKSFILLTFLKRF